MSKRLFVAGAAFAGAALLVGPYFGLHGAIVASVLAFVIVFLLQKNNQL